MCTHTYTHTHGVVVVGGAIVVDAVISFTTVQLTVTLVSVGSRPR